jgi:hypothetical protein
MLLEERPPFYISNAPLSDTDFEYVTSEEESASFIGTISRGTIRLRDRRDNSNLDIRYRCLSAGSRHGSPVNIANSEFENYSTGGIVQSNRRFHRGIFPCPGYMVSLGGSIGITQTTSNGFGGSFALFGMLPAFAVVNMAGAYVSALPGIGFSVGIARYWVGDGPM